MTIEDVVLEKTAYTVGEAVNPEIVELETPVYPGIDNVLVSFRHVVLSSLHRHRDQISSLVSLMQHLLHNAIVCSTSEHGIVTCFSNGPYLDLAQSCGLFIRKRAVS